MLQYEVADGPTFRTYGNQVLDEVSIISLSQSFDVRSLLSRSFYYEATGFNGLDVLLREATGSQYWIELTNGQSLLVFDSTNETRCDILLSRDDIFHNNYIYRYLTFKEHKPVKLSIDTETYFSASAEYPTPQNLRYGKDPRILIERVFSNASLRVSLDKEFASLASFKKEPRLKSGPISPDSDLSPLGATSEIDPHDHYEYLSLLHMNKVPHTDPSEYVKVTSMYEVPKSQAQNTFNAQLTIHFVTNINPQTLGCILQHEDVLSTSLNRPHESDLVLKSANKVYIWRSRA